jgi:hypothetical protein
MSVFRQGLYDLGHVEGKNIAIEDRYAGGKLDRLPALAAELVRLKVDVILTSSAPGALVSSLAQTDAPAKLLMRRDTQGVTEPVSVFAGFDGRKAGLFGGREWDKCNCTVPIYLKFLLLFLSLFFGCIFKYSFAAENKLNESPKLAGMAREKFQ